MVFLLEHPFFVEVSDNVEEIFRTLKKICETSCYQMQAKNYRALFLSNVQDNVRLVSVICIIAEELSF